MKISTLRLVSLFAVSCSGVDVTSPIENAEGVELSQVESDIIRSTSTGGRNEAVMLYILYRSEDGNI